MKKLMLFAAAIVALAACNKESSTDPEPQAGRSFAKGETITVISAVCGTKISSQTDGSFLWQTGDQIKVTVGDKSSIATVKKITDGGAKAEFEIVMPEAGNTYSVQYPADESSIDLTSQTYKEGSLPDGKMLFKAENCAVPESGVASFTLTPKSAGLQLRFYGTDKSVNKVVVTLGSNTYTLTSSSLITLGTTEEDATSFRFVVPAGVSSTVTAEVFNGATSLKKFTGGTTNQFNAGQILGLPAKSLNPTNLSENGTANSYIVPDAGDYMFNASVKGNSSEPVGIPASAEVLWESFGTDTTPSVGDIIAEGISLKDGWVYFSTSSSGLKNGNAVIAVKDAGGNILWSWHIWVCNAYNPASASFHHVYNNNAGTMMDRNLGATSAEKGDVQALGLLYQWGRKDPFLGAGYIDARIQAASTITWPSPVQVSESHLTDNTSLAYVTSHPTTFLYNNASPNDWYCIDATYRNDNLWKNTSGTGSVKTMYDPCPPGWRVPDSGKNGVWYKAGFPTSYTFDDINCGMDFAEFTSSEVCWYPAAGYRHYENGSLRQIGSQNNCWSCSVNNNSSYCLVLTSSGIVTSSTSLYRAPGYSVRCLAE